MARWGQREGAAIRGRVGQTSRAGRGRIENQDRIRIVESDDASRERTERLLIIAQGRGRLGVGGEAAELIAERIETAFYDARGDDLSVRLVFALQSAGEALRRDRAQEGWQLVQASAIAAAIADDRLVVASAGGLRSFLVRGTRIRPLTSRLPDGGLAGADATLAPAVVTEQPRRGDRIILGSSGLDVVELAEVLAVVSDADPPLAAEALAELAARRGTTENISVVVDEVGGHNLAGSASFRPTLIAGVSVISTRISALTNGILGGQANARGLVRSARERATALVGRHGRDAASFSLHRLVARRRDERLRLPSLASGLLIATLLALVVVWRVATLTEPSASTPALLAPDDVASPTAMPLAAAPPNSPVPTSVPTTAPPSETSVPTVILPAPAAAPTDLAASAGATPLPRTSASPNPTSTVTSAPSVTPPTAGNAVAPTAARTSTSRPPTLTTRPSITRLPTSTPTISVTASPAAPSTTPKRAASPTIEPSPVPAVSPTLNPPLNQGGSVELSWNYGAALEPDEYFDVRVWQSGQAPSGIANVRQASYVIGGSFPTGAYLWTIAVVRHLPSGSIQTVSLATSTSTFTWAGATRAGVQLGLKSALWVRP